jgi:hypothetical protein
MCDYFDLFYSLRRRQCTGHGVVTNTRYVEGFTRRIGYLENAVDDDVSAPGNQYTAYIYRGILPTDVSDTSPETHPATQSAHLSCPFR